MTRLHARFAALAPLLGSLLFASLTPTLARAAVNPTTPGALTAAATMVSASFEWQIAGDDNGDCAVTLEYRRPGEATWRPAQPLMRVEHGLWTHGEDPGDLLAGSLFSLSPATAYEARLTLHDPDGGADQRIVSFTTRGGVVLGSGRALYVAPGSGGGNGSLASPFLGLAAADAAAQPGDLFQLLAGTYRGTFSPRHDGTAAAPITYRGIAQASVILDANGDSTGSSPCLWLRGRSHLVFERLSLFNGLIPVRADTTSDVTIRGCHIRPIARLLSTIGLRGAGSRDMVVADNLVEMQGQWATIGRTGAYGTGGYGILLEGPGHMICHNSVIEAWDAISIPVASLAVPTWPTSSVDVYENSVDRASDDGVQADATAHNIRIFRNRLLNTGSAVSFQPIFGGPGYVIGNEIYNVRIEPYKFHQETFYGWTQETSGFVVMHNTSFCNRNGWYESGVWHHGHFRNNLLLGGRVNTPTFTAGYTYPLTDFDRDGYDRVNGYATLIHFAQKDWANLPAFDAGTGNEQHGIEVATNAFVNATLPHDPQWDYTNGYGAAYTATANDLRLAAGSVAIDRGEPLANIDDGFAGAAPDLGCYESGAALPPYGPRVDGQVPTVVITAPAAVGSVPVTVHFAAAFAGLQGLTSGARWDFGDGTPTSDQQNPDHTYTRTGTFTVTASAIDDDGTMGSASKPIVVGVSAGVNGETATLSLSRGSPNPFTRATAFRLALPRRERIALEVFDLRGARVRTLAAGELEAGDHDLAWDGRDDGGRDVAPGLYLVRLEAGAERREQRVVRIQ